MAGPADTTQGLETYLRAEQLSLLTRNRADQYAGLFAATATIAVVWRIYPSWLLALWFGVSCGVVFLRAHLARRCNAAVLTAQSVRRWTRLFAGFVTLIAILWGLAGTTMLLTVNLNIVFFVIMVTGGLMAGGVSGNAASRPAMIGCALGAQVPIILALLALHDSMHLMVAALLTVFTAFILSSGLKFNRVISDNIRMRFSREALLAQVQSSEAAMADAQRLAMTGSWVLDLKTNIVALSPEAYRIFGIDSANRNPDFGLIEARIHPDDVATVNTGAAKSRAGLASGGLDHRIIMDDGTVKYLHVSPTTVLDASGRATQVIGSIQDVTARRAVEDRLQFANILLNTQMESSRDGILVVDPTGKIVAVNQRYGEVSATRIDDLLGQHFSVAIARVAGLLKDPDGFLRSAARRDQAGGPAAEIEYEMADGRIVSSYMTMLRAPGGQFLGRASFFTDITERRLAEQKLQFANILLSTQMEASPDGILVVDSNNIIVALNKRYGKHSNARYDDLVGQNLGVALDRVRGSLSDQSALARRVAAVTENRLEVSEVEFEMADGRLISRYTTPLRAANGSYLGRAWFYSDITERKRAEKALAYRDRLLHTVTAATAVAVSALSLAEGVNTALAKIGESMGVDRILVFREEPGKMPPLALVFAWESKAAPISFKLAGSGAHVFNPAEMAVWRAPLAAGTPVIGQLATATGAVRDLMDFHGTQSCLLTPVFVGGALWGFLGIDACTAPRDWAASEIETVGILADITGSLIVRERARIALATSEQRFRLLTSTARDAVTLTDDAAIIRQWNQAAEQMFGYAQAEALGKDMISLLGPRGQRAEIVRRLQAVTEFTGLSMELSLRRKDGGEIAVELSISAARLGDQLEFIIIMRDISERKSAEQKLQFANILLNMQMEASRDGILVVDVNRNFLSCNQRFAEMWGLSLAEARPGNDAAVRAHILGLISEPEAYEARVKYLAENTEAIGEEEIHTNDGRTLERFTRSLFAAGGGYLGRVWFFSDVTARKAAAENLQFANILLNTQMEASPDGIMVLDANRRMVTCNKRYIEIWRLPAALSQRGNDDARRDHINAQLAAPEAYIARVEYLLDHPEEVSEDEVLTADGRTLDRYSQSMLSPTGEYLGRVWFFGDVTARKQAEQKLMLSNALMQTQLEASPDGIYVVGADRQVLSYNQRFVEMFALSETQMRAAQRGWLRREVGKHLKNPESFENRIAFLNLHTGEAADDVLETVDGRIIEQHSVSLLAPDQNLGRAWFYRDTTDRRRAEQKLLFANTLMKTQMEASPDGVYVVGPGREILSYNQRFADMFQVPDAEFQDHADTVRARIVGLLKDPGAFAAQLAGLYADPNRTLSAELETHDGRIIELITVALRAEEQSFGRAWFVRDVTARRAADALALRVARYDALTGLANRAIFVESVNQAIAHARRDGTGFAVLFLDLDHFKDINDTLGHPAGDALLKGVAARLLAATRETDTVGRFGGDEFAVILSGIQTATEAGLLAEKLITAINVPLVIELNTVHVRASIGIELFSNHAEDSEALLAHADVALYRAKAEGRGTFRFFTAAMDRDVRGRVTLGTELREALAAGELFLLYQPQVEATTGRLLGVEALIRWRHPTRGILPPDTFIPAAETTGAITQLGHFVLWNTCRQAAAWRDAGLELPRISFNVSALQFKGSTALEADITEVLAEFSLPARILELELTESVLMDTTRENNNILRRLNSRGIKLAIDDFGTGYSSLEYLRRFPADHIKIAQSFTKNIETESSDASIVRAIIGLANELNIATIAEGIETRSQMDLITSWGCTQMQGYYFSRPVPGETITAILTSGGIVHPQPHDETPTCHAALDPASPTYSLTND